MVRVVLWREILNIPYRLDRFLLVHEQLMVAHVLTMSAATVALLTTDFLISLIILKHRQSYNAELINVSSTNSEQN